MPCLIRKLITFVAFSKFESILAVPADQTDILYQSEREYSEGFSGMAGKGRRLRLLT